MLFNQKTTFSKIATIAGFSFLAIKGANAEAEALPWANANPQAAAAAKAFANAYAEAEAIGHPDPEAYAYAASADDCATVSCHASCGLMILAGSDCAQGSSAYNGPYEPGCLCDLEGNTAFQSYYDACLECGWTLWKYYGGYLSSALDACAVDISTSLSAAGATYTGTWTSVATTPTGTERCSTTLTSSYTTDPDFDYTTFLTSTTAA